MSTQARRSGRPDDFFRRSGRLWFCFLVSFWAGLGCQPSLDTRTVFLLNTLIDSDRDLLSTRPQLVAQKYELMASGLQPFLRGTAVAYYRDISRYQDGRATLPHGEGAEQTQLYGDVHLENIGVTFDSGGALLDVIDFDATLPGPFAWDLRRAQLALGVALSIAETPGETMAAASDALARSYARTLAAAVAAQPMPLLREGTESAGAIVTELLADGRKRFESKEELTQYTEVRGGRRVILRSDDRIDMPEPHRSQLSQWIELYRATRYRGRGEAGQFVVLDAVQRLGAGVASWPNLRFWVLLRGDEPAEAGESQGQEWLLEFKEERDPPQPTQWLGRGPLGSNGQRVFSGTRCLLSSPDSEPDLGYVVFGSLSLQVRRVLRGRRDLDVLKLAERLRGGRYAATDVVALANTMGGLLASGHARCGDAQAVLAALGGTLAAPDAADFVADSQQAATADLHRLRRDFALFRDAHERLGPLLGARLPSN